VVPAHSLRVAFGQPAQPDRSLRYSGAAPGLPALSVRMVRHNGAAPGLPVLSVRTVRYNGAVLGLPVPADPDARPDARIDPLNRAKPFFRSIERGG